MANVHNFHCGDYVVVYHDGGAVSGAWRVTKVLGDTLTLGNPEAPNVFDVDCSKTTVRRA